MDARLARGQVSLPISISERITNELRALPFGGFVAGVNELLRLVVVRGGERAGFRQNKEVGLLLVLLDVTGRPGTQRARKNADDGTNIPFRKRWVGEMNGNDH